MRLNGWVTGVKSRLGWSSLAGLVLACGSVTSSPGGTPNSDAGGDGSSVKTGGAFSGLGGEHNGGGPNHTGGNVVVTAGTSAGQAPDQGGASEGGQANDPGPVWLCIYDQDLPENWSAGGAADVTRDACAIGVLGDFNFMGCRYELLYETAFNVDSMVGGHSRCCYQSKLIDCD